MNKFLFKLMAVFVLASMALSACGGGNDQDSDDASSATEPSAAAEAPAATEAPAVATEAPVRLGMKAKFRSLPGPVILSAARTMRPTIG